MGCCWVLVGRVGCVLGCWLVVLALCWGALHFGLLFGCVGRAGVVLGGGWSFWAFVRL